MAAWQFALYLLPRSRLLELYDAIPGKIDWDTFDTVKWWHGEKLWEEAEPFLDSFSRGGTHWHKETMMWGDIDSDMLIYRRTERYLPVSMFEVGPINSREA